MTTTEFWKRFELYLKSADTFAHDAATKLAQIRKVATGDHTGLHKIASDNLLPIAPYQEQWEKVRRFLESPDVVAWHDETTIDQLTLVASGVRNHRMHDNCHVLPLYD